jgi:hypothetical protein
MPPGFSGRGRGPIPAKIAGNYSAAIGVECPFAKTDDLPKTALALFPPQRRGRFLLDGPTGRLTSVEQKENITQILVSGNDQVSSNSQPGAIGDDGLEAAVDQAIAMCGGDKRSAIRALIVANEYLESEVAELMKAVSHAYARGRFHAYSG